MRRALAILALGLGLGGCLSGVPDAGVPVGRAFQESRPPLELVLRRDPSPLSARPFVPVYHPPEIVAVYVPGRVSSRRDLLIGDHWIFLKLNDGGWFPERERDASGAEPASQEEIRGLLRRLAPIRFDEAIR